MLAKVIRPGLHLVPKPSENRFRVGEVIPSSGIYQVFHQSHRRRHEVTLLKGEKFPPCNKCGEKVCFELVRGVPQVNEEYYGFKIRLFEIPHPAEEQEAEETA